MYRPKLAFVAAGLAAIAMFFSQTSVAESTLQTVKTRGTMIAGVRFDAPPYGSVDANGKNVGIDVDIASEIARRLGVKLQLVQVTAQSRIPTLNSGKIDLLIADLTHTREREKAIDFTETYIEDGVSVMVHKNSGITKPSDLNGKSVSFVQGSTADAALKKAAPQAKITVYQEYPQAYLAFQQGLTDSFLSDALILGTYAKSDPANLVVLSSYLTPEPIAIGVRKNDSEWRTTLDEMIQDMSADGTWSKIVEKYVTVAMPKPRVFP
jgi:polar amino acid transport system substrate-binding protein